MFTGKITHIIFLSRSKVSFLETLTSLQGHPNPVVSQPLHILVLWGCVTSLSTVFSWCLERISCVHYPFTALWGVWLHLWCAFSWLIKPQTSSALLAPLGASLEHREIQTKPQTNSPQSSSTVQGEHNTAPAPLPPWHSQCNPSIFPFAGKV